MAKDRTRTSKRPFYHSWYFLIPLAIVFVFFVKSTYASFAKKRSADLEREKYEERFESLKQKKADLEAKIEKLETDRGIEDELRTRFNIVKEGETVIRIIEDE